MIVEDKPLFTKTFHFYPPDRDDPLCPSVEEQMADKINAFEEIGLYYIIKRTNVYGVGAKAWDVKFYLR